MDWLRELLSRCASLLRRKRLDRDLDDEVEAHLELADSRKHSPRHERG